MCFLMRHQEIFLQKPFVTCSTHIFVLFCVTTNLVSRSIRGITETLVTIFASIAFFSGVHRSYVCRKQIFRFRAMTTFVADKGTCVRMHGLMFFQCFCQNATNFTQFPEQTDRRTIGEVNFVFVCFDSDEIYEFFVTMLAYITFRSMNDVKMHVQFIICHKT